MNTTPVLNLATVSIDLDISPTQLAIEQVSRELARYADQAIEKAIRKRCGLPDDLRGQQLQQAISGHELTMLVQGGMNAYYLDGQFLVGTKVYPLTMPGHIAANIAIYHRE